YEIWVANLTTGVNSLSSVVADTSTIATVTAPDISVVSAAATLVGTITSGGAPATDADLQLFIPSKLQFAGPGLFVQFALPDSQGNYATQVAPASYEVRVFSSLANHVYDNFGISAPGALNVAL